MAAAQVPIPNQQDLEGHCKPGKGDTRRPRRGLST